MLIAVRKTIVDHDFPAPAADGLPHWADFPIRQGGAGTRSRSLSAATLMDGPLIGRSLEKRPE
jgi:hypothetical protein